MERVYGRISAVLATNRCRSGEHLKDTLQRYGNVYNHRIPQQALGHICPVEAREQWQLKQPERFVSEINISRGLTLRSNGLHAAVARLQIPRGVAMVRLRP